MRNDYFFQDLVEAVLEEPDKIVAPALFAGTLEADDSDPDKPWAYLKIEQGIPKAAYEALEAAGIPCEPRFDNPHVTVIKNDEAKDLIDKFGKDKWKDAVTSGPEKHLFSIHELVNLDPDGWDEMDRVWFLRCESPSLSAKRVALNLTPLPTAEDDVTPQDFHITVAVRPSPHSQEESVREALIERLLLFQSTPLENPVETATL